MRRYGRFSISHEMIRKESDELYCLFANMIIVKAEAQFATDNIEYVAISKLFGEMEENECIPEYRIIVNKHEDGTISFSAERKAT